MDRNAVDETVQAILADWESGFRARLKQIHEWNVIERRDELRQIEEAAERERQRIAAEERALRQDRHRLLERAMRGMERADRIRGLVEALDARGPGVGTSFETAYALWRRWALSHAQTIDLRSAPDGTMDAWIAAFKQSGPPSE
jgi:hypothetical protein